MNSIATITSRLLDRLFQRSTDPTLGAEPCVIDGLTALALIESRYAGCTALGGTTPSTIAQQVFSKQTNLHDCDELGEAFSLIDAPNPRSAFASAMGLAMSGRRATIFLSGSDLLCCQDLIARCVYQRLPLVIHVALHQESMMPSHDAYHVSSNTGCMQFFAINVQDAIDLTMIARQVAETTLVPVIIAIDAHTTAVGSQTAILPTLDEAELWLGYPADEIKSPTESQRIIFGEARRLVPRRWDVERPLLLSPTHSSESRAFADAARKPYFDSEVEAVLTSAQSAWRTATRRAATNLHCFTPDNAKTLYVTQGSLVEDAISAAQAVNNENENDQVAVVGIRCLRPFPNEEIQQLLRCYERVVVLETSTPQLCGDGPLTTEIRASIAGLTCQVTGVTVGISDAKEIATYMASAKQNSDLPSTLGIPFSTDSTEYPKRTAAMDELERAYPHLALHTQFDTKNFDLRPAQSCTIAVHRLAGEQNETFANELAHMLHATVGGSIRTRYAMTQQRFDEPCVDYVVHFAGDACSFGVPAEVNYSVTPIGNPLLHQRLPSTELIAPNTSGQTPHWHASEIALASTMNAFLEEYAGDRVGNATIVETRKAYLEELGFDQVEERTSVFEAALNSTTSPVQTKRVIHATSPSPLLDSNLWDDQLGSLPRFWDQTGVLYKDGNEHLAVSDPYRGIDALPPLTASMRSVCGASSILPLINPMKIDGDPSLWTTCPDGSIAAMAISSKRLIEAGISLARGPASSLRSIATPLAKHCNAVAQSNMQPTAGDLLTLAFEAVDPPAERRESLQVGLDAVIQAIGSVPLSKTPVFFDELENQKKGTGEFLIVTVNPDACKSPELILHSCSEHGIESTQRSEAAVSAAKSVLQLVHSLPDTSGETIQRVAQIEGMQLPAILLSRHCHHAMSAGDAAEAGSGMKLAVRQTLALAEYQTQPRLQKLVEQTETIRTQLQERATALLTEVIPTDKLHIIASAIESSGQDEVDLGSILSSISQDVDGLQVDGESVRLIASLVTELEDISHRLLHSAGGLGRARSGLIVSGSTVASQLSAFPWNPFATPVAVDVTNTGISVAAGLFEGQQTQLLADLNTIRRAQVALDNPLKAANPDERIEARSYQELTEDERALCPAMIMIADGASLQGSNMSEVAWLMHSSIPITLIVLGDGTTNTAMETLLIPEAFVAQCSVAFPDHFANATLAAIQSNGPALVHVYAASPEAHGFTTELLMEQSRLAVESRVHPLFTYDPSSEGVFGTCLDVSMNPSHTEPFVIHGETECSPSDWASKQQRFALGYSDDELMQQRWKVLQELAGIVTPFDAIARAEIDAAEIKHQQELQELASSYETQISQLRDQYHAEALASVTHGLINMAASASMEDTPS